MVSDRQSSAGYGYGGAGAGRGKSSGGPSLGGKQSGPGSGAKGSPRTKHVGSIADYEKTRFTPRVMDYVPSVANKAVTGKFIASEPEYRQAREIKEAYRDYRPSPPHAGMTGSPRAQSAQHKGMNRAEVAEAIQAKSVRPDRPVSKPPSRPMEFKSRMTEETEALEHQKQRMRTPSPDWMGPRQSRKIGPGITGQDYLAMRMVPSMPGRAPPTSSTGRKKGEIPTPTPRPSRESPKSPGLLGRPQEPRQYMDMAEGAQIDQSQRQRQEQRQNRGRFGPQPPPAKEPKERQASSRSRSGYRGGRV